MHTSSMLNKYNPFIDSLLAIALIQMSLPGCPAIMLSGNVEPRTVHLFFCMQVLANIETAQRQQRLFDALKEGSTAIKALQSQVRIVWAQDGCFNHP